MKPNAGGAVFGKPSVTRRSFSGNGGDLSKQNSEEIGKEKEPHPKTSNKEAKLKLIQMEIAEREACNVIGTLCADAAALLPPSEMSLEVNDLLSGILLLGNLARRIGYEKVQLEKKTQLLQKDKEVAIADKNAMIEQLEGVVMRMQGENIKLSDQIAEANIKHGQKVAGMSRELFNQREIIGELREDITKLQTKVQYQERRMMDMPRMEEGYLRQARGMIRQQEMANTMNKIEWKKVEEEAKQCQIWKSKAKALEETVETQRVEIEQLTITARTNFSKFQQATQVLNNIKSGGKGFSTALSRQLTASGLAKQQQQQQPQQQHARPSSAPSVRRSSNLLLSSSSGNVRAAVTDEAGAEATHTIRRVASTATMGADESKMLAEIERLKEALEEKAEKVLKLSQLLSRARAYPLMSTHNTSSDAKGARRGGGWVAEDDDLAILDEAAPSKAGKAKRNVVDLLDEDLELTAEQQAEELVLEERRLAEALTIQRDYNERTKKTRATNPPHIAAIRNSKSFAKDY